MEWTSLKSNQRSTQPKLESTQAIYGFHLEHMRKQIDTGDIEYFYTNPLQHIHIHEVESSSGTEHHFYLFTANGATKSAHNMQSLQQHLAAMLS
jgi:hypothetical protein